MIDEKQVYDALSKVMDPELNRNLVDLNMIRNLEINHFGQVKFTIALTTPGCPLKDRLAGDARQALMALPGVRQVEITFGEMTKEELARIMPKKTILPKLTQFNKVDHLIAIMSGKGGVGKSSVTALLAVALNRQGKKVGILDADITGPSIPRLFGLPSGGLRGSEQGILPAVTQSGIKVVSTNLLLKDEDAPVIWRGPLITGVIQQFWTDTLWGNLDYLLVDLPPGTSDAALTVTQRLPLQGVLLVTTPQELAAMVVKKAVGMITASNIPLLGVVENMSFFRAPDTGKEYSIFGESHANEIAIAAHSEVLIHLPITPEITQLCDTGKIEQATMQEINDLADKIVEMVAYLPKRTETEEV
ncbi:MAG: Mrp/NBP35 family ATP-binding protein [Anaerolineaceae bacterium]